MGGATGLERGGATGAAMGESQWQKDGVPEGNDDGRCCRGCRGCTLSYNSLT